MKQQTQYYKDNLYSRQIGVLGDECMKKISHIKACLIHLDTTGFEIAKCLVLMGIKQLYIYDSRVPNASHIGLNIALIKDCTDSIAIQTKKYLDILNPFVEIIVIPDINYHEILPTLPIQVCIQTNIQHYVHISNYCHMNNVKYIFSYQYNLTGYIFNDFGYHTIYNVNGEKPLTSYVKKCYQQDKHISFELREGHFNHNSKIKCIHPALDTIYTITKNVDESPNIIHIHNEDNFDFTKINNILIQEYKECVHVQHTSLESHLNNNKYVPDVIGHISQHKDATESIQTIHEILQKSNQTKSYSFPIIGSILGSIIAQEVIKTTGMYMPIQQQYIIDYSELSKDIPEDMSKDIPEDMSKDIHDPYYHIHNILPNDIIKKLKALKIFLVGCGALGCEYLKYFHQLNMASSTQSSITLTDMDHIELSNLNRQFLFRENNIGQSKSITAAQSIKNIHSNTNTPMHIRALDKELSKSTEKHFNHSFWTSKDVIINALDNIPTRQYVDEKCVVYEKPLFESGTLGTKCNVQIIIPHKTITYSETQDPPQKEIPVCTIKNFPYSIDHCISWALELFNYHFNIVIHSLDKLCNQYILFNESIDNISNINNKYELLLHTFYLYNCIQSKSRVQDTFIIKYLIILLNKYYITNIQSLQQKHPRDFRNEDDTYFWSGHKLYPTIINVNENRSIIHKWVEILYNVLTNSIPTIQQSVFTNQHHVIIDKYLNTLSLVDFTLEKSVFQIIKKSSQFNTLEQFKNLNKQNLYNSEHLEIKVNMIQDAIDILTHKTKHYKQPHIVIRTQIFDKDHLTNKHIDTITELANFRANNYGISKVSIPECRMIAGNIIPALSTTTTLVTALSIMELLKHVSKKDIPYTDHFINMGINTFIQSTPMNKSMISSGFNNMYGCNIITKPKSFSIWDKIIIHVEESTNNIAWLIQTLQDTYTISISILSIKDKIIYTKDLHNTCKQKLIMEDLPKQEYIQLDVTEFEGDSLVVYPNIVLYYE